MPATLPNELLFLTQHPLQRVGIVGVPPLAVIQTLNTRNIEIFDLDALLVREDMETTLDLLPRVYCAILRTVVLNAIHLPLDAIVIDVGPGKCDAAFHVATILKEELAIPVITTINQDNHPFGTSICRTKLGLIEKMSLITEGVKSAAPSGDYQPCLPEAGFWGVPPRDFSILEHFPATTHIYGWSRCMENKTPADTALEVHCNLSIPTIFFAQTFCAKTALAKHLARRHPRALFLDIDLHTGSSAKAKIEAFLELSGVNR
ncbi:MAG: hypothetical protein KJ950_13880 [Proteobacteria bacterium]|nr:hypothetical protein [Pseudomonadota bacterium]MBU1686099.1 hypothetical protein [Pseudomonadota bacterium]